MSEEIDEKTRFILRFIGLLVPSVLIPLIGLFFIIILDITTFDRAVSDHLTLYTGMILFTGVTFIDYTILKKNKKSLLVFFIVLNFVMAVPVFQTFEYNRMGAGPTTPEKKARIDLLSVPSEPYSALTILPPPAPKRSDGSYGAHTTSSAVRSYIYNAYDLFLLSDPTEIRIPLTFLKDPQENA
ncbi:MAG: hypothetical protein U9N35_01795, partial [Euryarchaeota archaeon]|nr:hypothetical protein [Euryarchaeota archaeon]